MTCPVCSGAGIDFSRSDAGTRHPCPRCEGTGDQPRHPQQWTTRLPAALAKPNAELADIIAYFGSTLPAGTHRAGPIRLESRHDPLTRQTTYYAVATVTDNDKPRT